MVARTRLLGQGQRYVLPLVHGDVIYVPSTALEGGGAWLEAYRITTSLTGMAASP
jgi:hypothetical protein